MRPLWIVGIAAVVVLMVASVASADMREELRSTAASTVALAEALTGGDVGLPSPNPAESVDPNPAPDETVAPDDGVVDDTDGDAADGETVEGNHGALVSAVARDKSAVGTKTLANGKTVTNHGQAVAAAAHQGKAGEDDGDDDASDGDASDDDGQTGAATHGNSGKGGNGH